MSGIAMAHHGHHHHSHGVKLPHVKLPALSGLEAKASSLMAVAQGKQGPGPQHMFLIGLALLIVIIFIGVRKMRRT